MTRESIGDKLITMAIQDTLREMVNRRGLRKVARELGVDHGSLYRSLNSDLRLSTLQAVLNLFGYDLKIVKRKEVKEGKEGLSKSKTGRG